MTSLVKALKEYFELPGSEMIAEFKRLTDEDKEEFAKMLEEVGYTIERPNKNG
jgi:hypothetical protein